MSQHSCRQHWWIGQCWDSLSCSLGIKGRARCFNIIPSPRCVPHYCSRIKLTWWKIMWQNIPSSRGSSCTPWTRGVTPASMSETSQGRNTHLSEQLGPRCCQSTAWLSPGWLAVTMAQHKGVQCIDFAAEKGKTLVAVQEPSPTTQPVG